jgi:hypothetical protein
MIGFIGIPVVGQYMQKQEAKMKDEQFAKGQQYIHGVEEQLRSDTDGGKTPEETLHMFIAALKAGDIEKAKSYYSLYPEKRSAMFKARLDQLNKEGKIAEMIELLGKIKEEKRERQNSTAWFSYIDSNKSLISIELTKAEQFSDIWKIESLAY